MTFNSIAICRFTLGFSWIYHGLFPKLISVAPLEKAMTATLGLSDAHSLLLTKSAGAAEVVFGLLIFYFYQSRFLLWTNIIALVALLIFVMVMMPGLLVEAFNPVTTNLALISLSVVLLNKTKGAQNNLIPEKRSGPER